jgi:hypothetical protein
VWETAREAPWPNSHIPTIPFSRGIGFAHAQMPELLRGRMGDPARVIIGKWSTNRLASQNLIQQVKKRAKRNGTTQTGKHDPARELDEKD